MSDNSRFKYAVAITAEPLSESAPVIFRGDLITSVEKAKNLGYDAVEIHMRDAKSMDKAALMDVCAKNDICVSAIATGPEATLNGLCMLSPDQEIRDKLMQNLKAHIDLAKDINAMVIIGMVRGNLGKDPEGEKELYKKQLCELADYAKERGVILLVEAINFYINNYLCTTEDTCDFIRSLGKDNVLLHIDTHHMNIEDYDPIESIKYAEGIMGYVHFCEINRMYPGAGRFDFRGVLKALYEIGFDGYISFECIPKPDPDTAATLGLAYTKKEAESF